VSACPEYLKTTKALDAASPPWIRSAPMHVPGKLLVLAALVALPAAGCGAASSRDRDGVAATPATVRASPVAVLGTSVALTPARAQVRLALRQPDGVDPPVARTARLVLAEGVAWHGGDAPTCSLRTLRSAGPGGCPRGAIVGSGEAIGVADAAKTVGRIVVVNGGPDDVYLATTVRNPVYVKTVVPGRLTAPPGGGLQIDLAFPPDLQTIAGVPLGLQQLRLSIIRGRALTVAACPAGGRWPYRASVAFADGTAARRSGAATCRDA